MTIRLLTVDKFIRKLGEVYSDISQSLHFIRKKNQLAGNILWKTKAKKKERIFIVTTAV